MHCKILQHTLQHILQHTLQHKLYSVCYMMYVIYRLQVCVHVHTTECILHVLQCVLQVCVAGVCCKCVCARAYD